MTELMTEGIQNVFLWIMNHLVFINILFSLVIIFFQRKNPTTVWAWLLVLYCIPVLGFVLYLILGQDFHKERMFKMKEIEDEVKYAKKHQQRDPSDAV